MSATEDTLEDLESRIRTILPEQYQHSYEEVKPISMGSAALRYDDNGQVAWDDMWESFCDLAMAGGPPHKGRLLLPGSAANVRANSQEYRAVVDEICRGITQVTDLEAVMSTHPGWVEVTCDDEVMAEWLVRAIAMENVSVRWEGDRLYLPASPHFRLEKEIKNVVTVIAKTCHYWVDHMWISQIRQITRLFSEMSLKSPLIQIAFSDYDTSEHRTFERALIDKVHSSTGLELEPERQYGWAGVVCPSVNSAIWLMRGLVASNILSRREGTTLFVPFGTADAAQADRVIGKLAQITRFARDRQVL